MTFQESRSKTYDAHGHVTWIGETEEKGAKRFQVRKFRIQTDGGKYSDPLEFEIPGDRCAEIDSLQVGEPVRVRFNIRGREWSRNASEFPRVYISLRAWKIESTEHPEDRNERIQREAHYKHAGLAASPELDERGETFDDSDIPF